MLRTCLQKFLTVLFQPQLTFETPSLLALFFGLSPAVGDAVEGCIRISDLWGFGCVVAMAAFTQCTCG